MSKSKFVPCHKPTEIVENLYLCGKREVVQVLKNHHINILIPLDSLGADIWEFVKPENISIYYFPIQDFGVLSQKNLEYLTDFICNQLKANKTVCLFCHGGHGRTGYVASSVLIKMGIKNPIQLLRTQYCEQAVETSSQIESLMELYPKNTSLKHYYGEQVRMESIIRTLSKNDFDFLDCWENS